MIETDVDFGESTELISKISLTDEQLKLVIEEIRKEGYRVINE